MRPDTEAFREGDWSESEWGELGVLSRHIGLAGWLLARHQPTSWTDGHEASPPFILAEFEPENHMRLAELVAVGSQARHSGHVLGRVTTDEGIFFPGPLFPNIRGEVSDEVAWDWQPCTHVVQVGSPGKFETPEPTGPAEPDSGTPLSLRTLIRAAFALPDRLRLPISLVAFYSACLSVSGGALVWFLLQTMASSSIFTPSEAIFGALAALALSGELLLGLCADLREGARHRHERPRTR
jgi:hypothetical protein